MKIIQGVCEMGSSAMPMNRLFSTLPRGVVHRNIRVCSAVAPNGRISSAKTLSGNVKNFHEQSSTRRLLAETTSLRSPNWDFNHVQSLNNEFAAEEYKRRCEVLKEQVKMMMEEETEMISQLELIDALQRLGLSYDFKENIHSTLRRIHPQYRINGVSKQHDLCAVALGFRLLRQHGFHVSPEIFDNFRDENGAFKASLREDPKGMIQLYEASYLQIGKHEASLELAREFAHKYLKENLDENRFDATFEALAKHSLEIPLHWRVMRLEARWFLDVYQKSPKMNPVLLELARLDFNLVQKSHQNELKYVSRWWKGTGMGEGLKFARDILVENFFWNVGIVSDPQHEYCRKMVTKIAVLITIIDDIYDIYGTLDELELFTNAVERWDINAIDHLPDYMKLCYRTLYNCVNSIAYKTMEEQGVNSIPYLRKSWADLCKAYLQEARWYFNGYTPTLEEYLNNAWVSVSAPLVLVHVYFCVRSPIKMEDLQHLHRADNIIRSSSMIVRLTNDLGTSPLAKDLKSGDTPKSVECYMKQTLSPEEEAREYVQELITEEWNEINKARLAESPFSPEFREIVINFARAAHCMYQHGDGHGHQNSELANHIAALLFNPTLS